MGENDFAQGQEIVVRRSGATWAFHLPRMHRIDVDREHALVSLSTPFDGSTYRLDGIEHANGEVVVKLGEQLGGHAASAGEYVPEPGYRLPEIHEELERLRGRWLGAGLPETEFSAWAEGASHDSHTAGIRRRLREHEANDQEGQ